MGNGPAPKRETRKPSRSELAPLQAAVKKGAPVDNNAIEEALKSASTFKTKGLSRADAHDYLKTSDGKKMLDELRRAAPEAGDKVIYQRARSMLSSGDVPKRMDAPKSLVKIVPAGEAVTGHSPFFTTEEELKKAMASGKPLHEYFGLPKKSESTSYDLYKIIPKEPTSVFSSKVSPTSELGGQIRKSGGGQQIMVPNRKAFTEPELMPISILGP